jgi:hypothetical protein
MGERRITAGVGLAFLMWIGAGLLVAWLDGRFG